jgi:sulfate adenylyltransferase subunit 2
MREVVAECERPVMMYSIGKDSAVMLHLARKAFYPARPPFPVLHVDTTWKFREMITFRDRMARKLGLDLIIHINPEGIEKGVGPFTHGSALHTQIMKTEALKQALEAHGFDAAFGGARRDEEKSRAKERIFLVPQRPAPLGPQEPAPGAVEGLQCPQEQGREHPGVPAVELDRARRLAVHLPGRHRDRAAVFRQEAPGGGARRPVHHGRRRPHAAQTRRDAQMRLVRFRTLGCYPLTGAIESSAATLAEIIQEMLVTTSSERQGRVIDHDQSASMEKKKQEGYF